MLATPPATPLSSPDKSEGLESPGSWPQSAWTAAPLKASAAAAVSAEGHDEQSSAARQVVNGDADAAAVQLHMSEGRAGELVHQWLVWRRALERWAQYARERNAFRRGLADIIRRRLQLQQRRCLTSWKGAVEAHLGFAGAAEALVVKGKLKDSVGWLSWAQSESEPEPEPEQAEVGVRAMAALEAGMLGERMAATIASLEAELSGVRDSHAQAMKTQQETHASALQEATAAHGAALSQQQERAAAERAARAEGAQAALRATEEAHALHIERVHTGLEGQALEAEASLRTAMHEQAAAHRAAVDAAAANARAAAVNHAAAVKEMMVEHRAALDAAVVAKDDAVGEMRMVAQAEHEATVAAHEQATAGAAAVFDAEKAALRDEMGAQLSAVVAQKVTALLSVTALEAEVFEERSIVAELREKLATAQETSYREPETEPVYVDVEPPAQQEPELESEVTDELLSVAAAAALALESETEADAADPDMVLDHIYREAILDHIDPEAILDHIDPEAILDTTADRHGAAIVSLEAENEVRFLLKNVDFLLKNVDFPLKNLDLHFYRRL